jgi:hypothetical protein
MKTYMIDLGVKNGMVNVNIVKKPIKNIHLKVYRDMTVNLSVPISVPDEWIVNFLNERISWIDKQITKYKESSGYNNLANIVNGSSTQLLGKDMRIFKKASLSNSIEVDEKKINVFLKDINDDYLANKLFENWWREKALSVFQNELDNMYNSTFRKYEIPKPIISIKKMKTLWGSCTKLKGKITLNEYLLKADIRCIQYVILHELTHLIYNYHNSDFYNFITVQMPDWKERKKQLDKEVVQGL